ncbi:hypothetical protein N9O57_01425 [bacterium]|nr:hypothetical protein [bacterium]
MQFNYRPSSSTIGNDRLRKAIERNRSKQTKRTSPSQDLSSKLSIARSANESTFATPVKRKSKKFSLPFGYKSEKKESAVKAKLPTSLRMSTPSRLSKASKLKRNYSINLPSWAVKLAWIACAILFVRLVFADRGVMDYYLRMNNHKVQLNDYRELLNENKMLVSQIEKVKKNHAYQKKLVRDHLGFISKNEFLLLFSKD